MNPQDISALIARVEEFTQHAEFFYTARGSLIFCCGKTLRPADLRALLKALHSQTEGGDDAAS